MGLCLTIENEDSLPDGGPIRVEISGRGLDIGRDEHLDWTLPDDEATTIAGLMIHEAQTIPTQGQVFAFHGLRFEVVERERHQVTKLRLKRVARRSRAGA